VKVESSLQAVANGLRPHDDGLIASCRFDWGGGETIGEEAILEAMSARPLLGVADALLIQSPTGAALIGTDDALFADIYDGRIGRLWRVGVASGLGAEPAVDVAFDPDLNQSRGDIMFNAGDHPGLNSAQAATVVKAAHDLLARAHSVPLFRARVFVIRVVAAGPDMAILAAVHRMSGGAVRTGGFGFGVAAICPDKAIWMLDPMPSRPWTTRL